MATLLDLAKEAFKNHNYTLSLEIYERALRTNERKSTDLYFGYGDSLAKSGRIKDALDIYSHICYQLCEIIPVEKLKCLATSIIEFLIKKRTIAQINSNETNNKFFHDQVDPLCCSFCEEVLKYPVTNLCGHSFCRECCFGRTKCNVCGHEFPLINILPQKKKEQSDDENFTPSCSTSTNNPGNIKKCTTITSEISSLEKNENESDCVENDFYQRNDDFHNNDSCNKCRGFEQDILIRKLVEKWWAPLLKASELNKEAEQHLERDLLDEALKTCNQSLEIAPNNFKGLLLRSHVLYRLNHFSSSLADIENALRRRPFSVLSHYRKALVLNGLGRIEESLMAYCISICLDKKSENLTHSFKYDLSKLLQRILISTRSINNHLVSTVVPYLTSRRQYKNFLSYQELDYEDAGNSSCGEGDDYQFLNRNRNRHNRRLFRRLNNINHNHLDSQQIIPRQNGRLRSLFDRIQHEIEKYRRIESFPDLLEVQPTKLELSDFDCVLCCRTLFRPTVTSCGHTYCYVCLDRCMLYSNYCPLCNAPLIEQYRSYLSFNQIQNPTLLSLPRRQTSRFIEAAMKRFIPKELLKRELQENENEPAVPIFICTNAFPSVPCPLFIYEPRYRLMVRRAVESGCKNFGIALATSGRQKYADYGTMLEIRDCLQLGDGCSILSTVGTKRFRVLCRSEKDGYDTSVIEYIKDEPICKENFSSVLDLHNRVMSKAKHWFKNLPDHIKMEIWRSFGVMPKLEKDWDSSQDGPSWTWWIIAILPLSPLLKVNILATTSLEKRLRAIEKTLNVDIAAQQKKALCLMTGCESLVIDECCENERSRQQNLL